MTQEADILAVVIPVCQAALGTVPVLTPTEVKNVRPAPPADYLQVSVDQRPGGDARQDPGASISRWRLLLRGVGATERNAQDFLSKVTRALEYRQLVVGATSTTPIELETSSGVGEDDDRWSGLRTLTFTL
ncbi:MAG: hypothetical protein QM714_02705 [Nocardioides sp.]|uniref:hypothetical protein n=1 Tax=Nocardioides sp. TaxID=35761 RepID=UPI0039E2E15C